MNNIEKINQFQENEHYELLLKWAYQIEIASYLDVVKIQGDLSTMPYCLYCEYKHLIDNSNEEYIYINDDVNHIKLTIVKE